MRFRIALLVGIGLALASGAGVALADPAIVVGDMRLDALIRVDPTTGDRTIVSGPGPDDPSQPYYRGPNFSPWGVALEPSGHILATDMALAAVLRVDPSNGERTILSGSGFGSGDQFERPMGVDIVEVQPDVYEALVTDFSLGEVFRVELGTGNRDIVECISAPELCTPFQEPIGVAVLEAPLDGYDALVSDSRRDALFLWDLNNGERTIVSGPGVGSGPRIDTARGVAVETATSALVVDYGPDSPELIRVNLDNGDRATVSGSGVGSGPAFAEPWDVVLESDGWALVSDLCGALFRVDLDNGDRTYVSGACGGDAEIGSGPSFAGATGIALVADFPPTEPLFDCRGAERSKLLLKTKKDKLKWWWRSSDGTEKTDFGNPALPEDGTVYFVCVFDQADTDPGQACIPVLPGSGWLEGQKGFLFRSEANGIRKVRLMAGETGQTRIVVKGWGVSHPELPLQQDPEVVVQLINSEGECWESIFAAPAKGNDARLFKDKTP